MKLLSFQPGSLFVNGGAGRVLRRLFHNHENEVVSIYVSYDGKKYSGNVNEITVDTWPLKRKWMRWKLRTFFDYLRDNLLHRFVSNKLLNKVAKIDFDILHIINHGPYSSTLVKPNILFKKKLWVSFHDHFLLCSTVEDCGKLWNTADRRFVISSELGIEYQKVFGNKDFDLITDGVYNSEISNPRNIDSKKTIQIYFGGLLHISYLPLFELLADALDSLSNSGLSFEIVLRGTQKVDFLNNRSFKVTYRYDFVTDEKVKIEQDQADILYLPIKFNDPEFYLYSLSTKMIGYLAASGTILYHGPENSAALNLLDKSNCASKCTNLNLQEMIDSLNDTIDNGYLYSTNAKNLARSNFVINDIQRKFWQK